MTARTSTRTSTKRGASVAVQTREKRTKGNDDISGHPQEIPENNAEDPKGHDTSHRAGHDVHAIEVDEPATATQITASTPEVTIAGNRPVETADNVVNVLELPEPTEAGQTSTITTVAENRIVETAPELPDQTQDDRTSTMTTQTLIGNSSGVVTPHTIPVHEGLTKSTADGNHLTKETFIDSPASVVHVESSKTIDSTASTQEIDTHGVDRVHQPVTQAASVDKTDNPTPDAENHDGNVPPPSTAPKAITIDTKKNKPLYQIKDVPIEEQVWQTELQDPELKDIYVNLHPRNPAQLIPFDNPPDDPNYLISFSDWEVMAKDPTKTKALVKACLKFESQGRFINPARVDVEKLLVPPSKGPNIPLFMTLVNKPEHVIHCSTGMISKNSLLSGKLTGANSVKPFQIKKAYLTHHMQEFEACVGAWGTVLGFESIGCDFFDMSVGASTGRNYQNQKAYSPQNRKVQAQLKQRGNQSAKSSAAGIPTASRQIKTSLNFFDQVPQYDARGIEDFTLEVWTQKLSDMPLYAKGEEDIPNGSAVVMGYTVGHAPARGTYSDTLFINVMWVILLGLPVEDEESEEVE